MDWIEKYENTTKDYRLTKPKRVDSVTLSFIYTLLIQYLHGTTEVFFCAHYSGTISMLF